MAMHLRTVTILILVVSTSVFAQRVALDRVVARVGTRAILQTDVQAAIGFGIVPESAKGQALDLLIDRYLALAEIDRSGRLEPDLGRVEEALAKMKSAAGGRLPAIMQSTGADESRLREMARETVLIETYLSERFPLVPANDIDGLQYYKSNPDQFRRNGTLIPYDEAAADARAAVAAERRRARIAQWTANLRDRIEVTRSSVK
jgi:hypothetical protein